MFFFRLKVSVTTDIVILVVAIICTRIVAVDLLPLVALATLVVEAILSMSRALKLRTTIYLWGMQKHEKDSLQREIDRLRSDNNKG